MTFSLMYKEEHGQDFWILRYTYSSVQIDLILDQAEGDELMALLKKEGF